MACIVSLAAIGQLHNIHCFCKLGTNNWQQQPKPLAVIGYEQQCQHGYKCNGKKGPMPACIFFDLFHANRFERKYRGLNAF